MIKVALVGLGNCASTLVQGIYYYSNRTEDNPIGLMHKSFGGYQIQDIQFVAFKSPLVQYRDDLARQKVEELIKE